MLALAAYPTSPALTEPRRPKAPLEKRLDDLRKTWRAMCLPVEGSAVVRLQPERES